MRRKIWVTVLNNRAPVLVAALFVIILLLARCMSQAELRGENYAGAETCRQCHADIYNSFLQTAHHQTSSNQLPDIVKAAFTKNANVFRFNDSVSVVMEQDGNNYMQAYHKNGKKEFAFPFDIAIGSGRKAQTYLYYHDGRLQQLPISYFIAEHSWANSPGFPSTDAKFDRIIPSDCLGCHSSFVSVKQSYQGVNLQEEFDKGKIVYGIDCERCHGPAQAHVKYFSDHPGEKQGPPTLTKISALSRVQKNDACALCHSGFRDVQQPLFNFKPGDDLSNYYIPDFKAPDFDRLDVHGNQAQLMMASKCYQLSTDLTCTSCHNVHKKEREDMTVFVNRCVNCHTNIRHSFEKGDEQARVLVQQHCIDCHMPAKPSSLITLLTDQKANPRPDFIRTHYISVYPDETKKWLDSLK